jgi:UDP-N-acetylglucosamine--N-acetylmuramyl-(pentapeptide) pyrophosphoryl-undecaprenol N-acetylglucosamine transferase
VKLVLCGGGTGGHIYPALAIAEAFASEPAFEPLRVLFVGTRDRLEATLVPKAGVDIAYVHAAPLVRARPLAFARTAFENARGFCESLAILHRAKPDVLIATGGYVTFPVVAALRAVRLLGRSRAKIALFEANAAAGLTNRLLGPLADETWFAIAPARGLRSNERLIGTPVRSALRRPCWPDDARRALGLDQSLTTIVVMGGSQGARSINDAVAGLVEDGLPPGWQIVVIAGARDFEAVRARLLPYPRAIVLDYLDDPRIAYAAADLFVARAGASTLGELAATGTPALLVPFPFATGDHQSANARAFAANGGARVLADADLSPARLRVEIETALRSLPALRAAAARGAGSDPRSAVVARVKSWQAANKANP